jgi:hypothetical protein
MESRRGAGDEVAEARKLVVLAAGISSRSGDTRRLFSGLRQYFSREGGFAADDFLEATYAGSYTEGRWVGPATYDITAFDEPLASAVTHCAQALLWAARQHPEPRAWHLVGYSLGGLILLEAAIVLHRRAWETWGRDLRTVTTLSAPLNGCALGELRFLGDLFGPGAIGPEVVHLGDDPAHRARIAAEVARLSAAGVTVTTLVEADDAIIQPEDGIVGPHDLDLVVHATARSDDSAVARHLGHGRILNETRVWRRLLEIVGPQTGRARPAPPGHVVVLPPPVVAAPGTVFALPGPGEPHPEPSLGTAGPPPSRDALLDQQLAELKARMRAEGKLP